MKTYWLIDDEVTGKGLEILAETLEEAEIMSTYVNFNDYEDGERVDPLKV